MAGSKFKERLASMRGNWESSQGAYDQMFGGAEIPEGLYNARLQSAKLTESKASQKLMVRREHLITDGNYKGMVVWDNLMLESRNGLVYLRRWLEMMGFECPGVEDFEEQLEPTIAAIVNESPDVEIRLTRDGDFTNVSVVKVLDSTTTTEAPAAPATPAAPPKAKPTPAKGADSIQGQKVETIRAFAVEVGCELKGTETGLELVDVLNQYEWKSSDLSETQVTMLTALGVPVVGAEVEAPAEANAEDEALREKLLQFCTAQDITYEADDTLELLKERVDGFEYPEDQLTEDEKSLLAEIGQEKNIKKAEKPTPPPAPAKKAPAKAAPAPATPAKAPVKAPPKKKA